MRSLSLRCLLPCFVIFVVASCSQPKRTLRGEDRDEKLRAYIARLDQQCGADTLATCATLHACADSQANTCMELAKNYSYAVPAVRDRPRGKSVYQQLCVNDVAQGACGMRDWVELEPRFEDGGFWSWAGAEKLSRRSQVSTEDAGAESPPDAGDEGDGGVTVAAGLPQWMLRSVITWRSGEVLWCYESQLADDPTAQGKLTTAFVISPSGAVSSVQLTAREGLSEEMGRCVVDQIKEWRFPEPEGGGIVNVTFPWMFRPKTPQK